MSYDADKLGVDIHIQTHGQTDAGNDNTRRPKLASVKNVNPSLYVSLKPQAGNWYPGVCLTTVSRALQNVLLKFVYCRNRISGENFKLKLCTCAQSHAFDTRAKFQLEILTRNMISGIEYFREITLENLWNVGETTPWLPMVTCSDT